MKMHIKMANVLQMYFCDVNIRLIRIKLRKVIISTLEIIKYLHIYIIRDTGSGEIQEGTEALLF